MPTGDAECVSACVCWVFVDILLALTVSEDCLWIYLEAKDFEF